ncbi:MAG: phage portal protein [Porcipelethomonas sp.]
MVLCGRREIFTKYTSVTDENIKEILINAFNVHRLNEAEIRYLYSYYRGNQPILRRVKKIRPEIDNKIVENHAQEIVNFKVGYVFGSPIQLVQRGKSDSRNPDGSDDNRISQINDMLMEEDKASKDREIGESMNICGVGYRMVLPKKNEDGLSPFDIIQLDPERTFVVKTSNIYHTPVLAVTYCITDPDKHEITVSAYSDSKYWEFTGTNSISGLTLTGGCVRAENNTLGMIPVVEYKNNGSMLGGFETVIPILDALNGAASDRLNDIQQFVQSLMWFNNCDISREQFEELRDMGAIKTKSEPGNPANVSYITGTLNQSETQTYVDYLYQTMLQIAGVPDRHSSTGGNTGQAIMLASGWQTAETYAKATELVFTKSEKQTLKLIIKILKSSSRTSASMSDLKLSDIEIKYTRNKTDSLQMKAQALLNLLEAGVHPRDSLSIVNLFSDPEQVWQNSEEFMQKWKAQDKTDYLSEEMSRLMDGFSQLEDAVNSDEQG